MNPPVPPVGPAGLGAAGPAQPVPCFYRDYFSDASNDPFGGDYTQVLQPYGVPHANQNVISPTEVQQLALSGQTQRVPTAFLLLLPDGKLHIFLQIARYDTRMGLPATQWDNHLYVQKGELYHNQAQLVTWDSSYFRQGNASLRVQTPAAIDTSFAGDPAAVFLGPHDAADADTEVIRYRRTCYVPPAYVPLFLASPVTPRQAWETCRAQIVAEHREVQCAPLIDFFRAAITRTTANVLPALGVASPNPPLADTDLLSHRRRILEQDFPLLNSSQTSIQQNQIATQLGILIQDNRAESQRAEQLRLDAKKKPLSSLIGTRGVALLLTICNVAHEDLLPGIYKELANASKSQQLSILQFAVDEMKRRCAEPDIQLIMDASHLQLVKNLAFELPDINGVTNGLTPFIFFERLEAEAYEASATWNALMSGTAGASSQDLAPLLKAKVKPPISDMHVRHMHRRLEVFCKVIFGEHHGIPTAIEQFLTRYMSMESTLTRLELRQPAHLRHTMVCRKTGLVLNAWFQKRRTIAGQLPPPDLLKFFDDIQLDNNWEQLVPATTLLQLGLSPAPSATALPLPLQPQPNAPVPLGPLSAQPTPTNTRSTGVRLNNTAFVASLFTRFKDMTTVSCKTLRDKIRRGELPALPRSKVEPSKPMCLAWHVRAECNSNCSCKYDHVTTYTESDSQELVTWCNENFHE